MGIEQLSKSYQPSEESIEILSLSKVVFLAGIMSAGKNVLKEKLVDFAGYFPVTTHTTRPKRFNNGTLEQDGVDYNFVTIEQMTKLLTEEKMVEVNHFGNNYYSSCIDEFKKANDQNLTAVVNIDVNGVSFMRSFVLHNFRAFFVVPHDCDVWIDRIKKRYGSLDSFNIEWQTRRETTIHELERALKTKYYTFIINGDLDETANLVDKIVKNEKVDYDDKKARDIAERLLKVIKRVY